MDVWDRYISSFQNNFTEMKLYNTSEPTEPNQIKMIFLFWENGCMTDSFTIVTRP